MKKLETDAMQKGEKMFDDVSKKAIDKLFKECEKDEDFLKLARGLGDLGDDVKKGMAKFNEGY